MSLCGGSELVPSGSDSGGVLGAPNAVHSNRRTCGSFFCCGSRSHHVLLPEGEYTFQAFVVDIHVHMNTRSLYSTQVSASGNRSTRTDRKELLKAKMRQNRGQRMIERNECAHLTRGTS